MACSKCKTDKDGIQRKWRRFGKTQKKTIEQKNTNEDKKEVKK